MSDQKLAPNQELGVFEGAGGERFMLVVSRTGRSIAVRTVDSSATAGRIWCPLEDGRHVEVEDRWRARGASWISDFRSRTLAAWAPLMLRFTSNTGRTTSAALTPSSSLGSFTGPRNTNRFAMVVSRTGRTVAARLGSERGLIVARANRPLSAKPRVVYQGMYRDNLPSWKREFRQLFASALRDAVKAAQGSVAVVEGAST